MTAKEMASGDATEIVADLERQLATHRKVIANLERRRAKFAFSAATGDKEAAASLAEIEVDERQSTAALKNLELALAEAREHRAAAWKREREEDDHAAIAAVEEMGAELIELDRAIAASVTTVEHLIADRAKLVEAICDERVLADLKSSMLRNDRMLGEGLIFAFGPHLQQVARFDRPHGGIERLVYSDAKLLGIEAEPPVLTAAEQALLTLKNSSWAS